MRLSGRNRRRASGVFRLGRFGKERAMKRTLIALVAAGSLLLSGCATLAGAGVGAGVGAVAAGATGGNVKKGAVIGGATGAVVGTVVH